MTTAHDDDGDFPEAMLTPIQARVLGSLMEKQMTTPDYYPLGLNALVAACNQKSSRNPVMRLDQSEVGRVVNELHREGLVTASQHGHVGHFEQHFTHKLGVSSSKERAIICMMLLRGAQTLNEIRVNTNHMVQFTDSEEIQGVLQGLMEREGRPLVLKLPRAAGQREERYTLWILRKFTRHNLAYRAQMILERVRGLDFTSPLEPEDVGLDPKEFHRSFPSGNKFLQNLLSDIDVNEEDAILDIGAGKGSAMYMMLKFPFKRVDGIEVSKQIANIAKRNFKRLRASKVHIYQTDARSFVHYARYNIFYLYNPFPQPVMEKVVPYLCKVGKESNREILVIYNNPACHDLLVASGIFKMLREYPDEWGKSMLLYSNREFQDSRIRDYQP